ncbi:MAG: SURF1 family cytochrome oxidase biogenesis protein [Candidatus Nanopelagicus sp.]
MKSAVRKTAIVLIWLSLIYTCYELGVWQLNRAQALNVATAPKPDQPLVALNEISSAGKNIPIKAVNRIVSATGTYSKSYIAKDQKISESQIADFDVRVLQLNTGHAVLVAREVLAESADILPGEVLITGRLYPRQNVDRTFAKPGQLPRIDPALVVSKENPFLYDGYIILRSEVNSRNQASNLTLIPSPQISERLPGFYWQHISYVVVWWFMGALLLIAPAFPQFRLSTQKVGDNSPKRVNKGRKVGVKK